MDERSNSSRDSIAHDLILVGGGLANSLIAWRLHTERPELRILLLEQGRHLGGNHTWSFHDSDLTAAQLRWIAPLVSHRWPGYDVVFPEHARALNGGYASIASPDFARTIEAALGPLLRTGVRIDAVTPTSVRLADGTLLQAHAVIDGRGPAPSPHLALGYQTFLGQEVRLHAPHGLTQPVIMDASVAQQGGYRFVYLLPFGPDRVLIEDTHYVDSAVWEPERLRANIAAYAAGRGWQIRRRAARRTGLAADRAGRRHRRASGLRWTASPLSACAPACSTRRPAIRCRTPCAWPNGSPPCPTWPRHCGQSLFAAIRTEAREEWRARASSACSTACCSWPAAPTTAGA